MRKTEVQKGLEDLVINYGTFPARLVETSEYGFVLEGKDGHQFYVRVMALEEPEEDEAVEEDVEAETDAW